MRSWTYPPTEWGGAVALIDRRAADRSLWWGGRQVHRQRAPPSPGIFAGGLYGHRLAQRDWFRSWPLRARSWFGLWDGYEAAVAGRRLTRCIGERVFAGYLGRFGRDDLQRQAPDQQV